MPGVNFINIYTYMIIKKALLGCLHFQINMEDTTLRFFTWSHMPRTFYTWPTIKQAGFGKKSGNRTEKSSVLK